eukprot:2621559-Amphidinium_carterae.2
MELLVDTFAEKTTGTIRCVHLISARIGRALIVGPIARSVVFDSVGSIPVHGSYQEQWSKTTLQRFLEAAAFAKHIDGTSKMKCSAVAVAPSV